MPAAAASATSASGVDRPSEAVVCRWRSITPSGGAGRRGGRRWRSRATSARYSRMSRSRCSRSSSANSRKIALAFGLLEALAVFLEELVRAALAADADEQRLRDRRTPFLQLLGAGGEQPVGRALEEQERRLRLELRIVARASSRYRASSLARCSFSSSASCSKTLRPRASRVMLRRARVELEAAALGRDRHPQRVAREDARRSASPPARGRRPVRQFSHVP